MKNIKLCVAALVSGLGLSGCMLSPTHYSMTGVAPEAALPVTSVEKSLAALPAPKQPIAIAVYNFADQTGQYKTVDAGQSLSRAVSQGGATMLVKSLQEAGNRRWFTIVEREGLRDLLNERQIIKEMRERYLGERDVNPNALPSLLFAGVILEGGVVGYDTSTRTGGFGARYLAIGPNIKYHQDTVTVYLRAVSVRTGEVLTTVTSSKTIDSYALSGGSFKYVAYQKLLELETGYTTNEPGQLALQQAIDQAVKNLVIEGAYLNLWDFADPAAGKSLVDTYLAEKQGKHGLSDKQFKSAQKSAESLKIWPAADKKAPATTGGAN